MTNASEAIAVSMKRSRVVYYELFWITMGCIEMFEGFLTYGRFLLLVALCFSPLFAAATAHPQELASQGFALASANFTTLCPPETAESKAAPHLLLSMSEPNHFRISDSAQTLTAQPSKYRLTERTDSSIENSGSFALAHEVLETKYRSPVGNHSLNPESILSVVETKYMRWESSLADSRSLTNVNGALVYPLVQINSGDLHLPITLNTAPIPGGETRW